MRNLLEYPITMVERIAVISRLYEQSLADLNCGDLTAAVLYDLSQDLKRKALQEEGIKPDSSHNAH
jgi:hypothetical protein